MTAQNEPGAASNVNDYDALPYLSLPIAYSHPDRLAALAALHGHTPIAPSARARVLELGCASGGNLLPMAARMPESHFVGYDLSAQQISDGNRRLQQHALKNVELIQADIAELDLPRESFDYVICHGVYSWVPVEVQRAILALIGACLSPQGVAAISYNVAPGWHLRSPVREILLDRAGEGGARDRVARARETLQMLATCSGTGAFGDLLRAEAKLLEKSPSSYILGEFLSEQNHAVRFSDFAHAAGQHALECLCEADLDAEAIGSLPEAGRARLLDLEAKDRTRAAQELDYLTGRPFRRTLLRKRQGDQAPPASALQNLKNLHIAARINLDANDASAFTDRRGKHLPADGPAIASAYTQLGEAYPATLSIDDLLLQAGADSGALAHALQRLVHEGRAILSARAVEVGRATDSKPNVWSFARTEAALGLPGITSLHHVAVAIPKPGNVVAALADGTRTRADLAAILAREISAGRIAAPPEAPKDQEIMPAYAAKLVEDTLHHLAVSAVLTP